MKLALLGDIAFYGKYSIDGNDKVFDYFAEVAAFLGEYDFVIGNLETPLVADARTSGPKSAYIKADPVNVGLLDFLHVQVVTLANNHVFDYGWEGFASTKKILDESGIRYFGIDGQQVLLELDGSKVALHGYCCFSTNPLGINLGRGGVDALNIPAVEAALMKNAEAGYFNIVSVHCGEEHVNYPNYDAILMARRLAGVAPYLFYGHHPHVMQGMETVGNSLLCYSLGNFCFDDVYTPLSNEPLVAQSENNKTGFILEVEIEGNKLFGHKVIPIYAAADRLRVGHASPCFRLEDYSKKLLADKEIYCQERSAIIAEYYASRRQRRDAGWYLKRMRPRYAMIVLKAYLNKRKYRQCVTRHLESLPGNGRD